MAALFFLTCVGGDLKRCLFVRDVITLDCLLETSALTLAGLSRWRSQLFRVKHPCHPPFSPPELFEGGRDLRYKAGLGQKGVAQLSVLPPTSTLDE